MLYINLRSINLSKVLEYLKKNFGYQLEKNGNPQTLRHTYLHNACWVVIIDNSRMKMSRIYISLYENVCSLLHL